MALLILFATRGAGDSMEIWAACALSGNATGYWTFNKVFAFRMKQSGCSLPWAVARCRPSCIHSNCVSIPPIFAQRSVVLNKIIIGQNHSKYGYIKNII